jgi:uncharacterized repeat protein (TIGR01451 family)
MTKRSAVLSTLGLTLVLLAMLGLSLTAQAAPMIGVPQAPTASDLRISQAYGGGGNTGALYRRDFIEIFNAGNTSIDISDWTVQYASATGTTWQATALSGTLAPGQYYLVAEAAGAGGTLDLPTPDITGTIAMGATGFKVALVNTTTLLSGACPIPATTTVVDFVGAAATASCFEGSGPAPAPSNTTSVLRLSAGCQDTDINATDFITVTPPTPRNTASATHSCVVVPQPDLVIAKSGPDAANSGEAITYTISLSNTGSATAVTTVVTDILPPEVSFVSYNTAALVTFTQASDAELVWELGDVLTDTPEINIEVVGVITTYITNGTVVTNTAIAASASPESNLGNNISAVTTTVSSPIVPDVEVYVQKSTPTTVVFGGELISYTIVYGNDGTQTVEATLTDTLPISFTTSDIAFDDSGLNAIDDTNTRSWTATLASGDRFTYTLALTVPTSIANGTLITNTIEITATGAGNNPIDDVASASSTVYQIVPISTARAGSNGQVFGVEGQVIYVPNTFGTNEWGVQDASGGIAVFYSPAPVVALGDRVRLVATRGAFSGQAQLGSTVHYFANLGPDTPVQPMPFTTGQITAGTTEGWLSVVTGTVSGLPVCTPGTANYQFNLDDGSGSTVIFVDKDTLVDVCALGVVNGDPLVVTGFSTQFNGLMEIKPRFQADVKRIYQITFVYNDLEDAVQIGEDVEVRGDFNGWSGTVMAHDAGYTVFSLTVTLPTTATQGYKYFVPGLSGNTGWDLLNTNNRSVSPVGGATLQNEYRNVTIGWGNMNGPAAQTINLGSPTASIDGQLYVQEVTNPAGAGRGLKAELGYGSTTDPSAWSWSPMAFASQTGNNDVYAGVITPTASGVYSYATRYNGNWGAGNPNSLWVYADLNGIPFSLDQTGVLTVTAPQLAIEKVVETANAEVNLGEVVTYTFTLSNTGDGTAMSVLITDVLPAGVTFGGFVQQNSAVYGSGAITWSGTLNAGASATVIFTATVKNDRTLHGTDILNTVQFTADNGGSGSDSAAFAVIKRYFLYLPLIQR